MCPTARYDHNVSNKGLLRRHEERMNDWKFKTECMGRDICPQWALLNTINFDTATTILALAFVLFPFPFQRPAYLPTCVCHSFSLMNTTLM